RVFPRLYLVNTETTQTANLNMNGGWLISDLGNLATLNGDGIDIWSGTITLTGDATTNIIDVNDAGVPEVHYISGAIQGMGGFSKVNTGSLNLTADNTLSGDVYIQRGGPGGSALASKGSLTLSGADGALSSVGNIVVSRDGSFFLDNSAATNNDRVNDSVDILLRGQGRLRVTQQAGVAVSETFGDLRIDTGSGRVNFDLHDTSPAAMSLTFASLTRDKGTISQFQVLDNTSGSFGPSGNAHLYIANGGSNLLKKGGDGANGSTSQSLVVGVFGGVNNLADHFMTFDKVNTIELRPLALSEYLGSRSLGHTLSVTTLTANDSANPYNKNLNIDYNPGDGLDPDDNWYGVRPIRLTDSVGVSSLRFGTNTPNAPANAQNNNELGSTLVLDAGTVLYLGDSLAASTGLATNTDGSGMVLFGRDINGTAPDSNQFIIGGALDFGSREALFVNESGNSALIRSEIRGTGGLTKAGANTIYLDGANSYTGVTNIAEGVLSLRHESALGGSARVNIEGNGQLQLEYGSHILRSTTSATPPDLFVGTIDGSRHVLSSNSANNTWGGNIIIDTVDALGNWVYTPYIGGGALATLNVDGDIYSNELANPINRDTSLNDPRQLQIVFNSAGGIVNLNGQIRDNANGVGGGGTGITSDMENQLLRVTISSSNEGVVNVRQPWNAAGRITLQQGILRYEGEGNFYTDAAASAQLLNASGQSTGNGQSGMRLGSGNNSTANTLIVLTKDGQVLNIPRIDAGGDGTNNYNGLGNNTLAGTNTSGTVTFGLGTDRYLFGSTSATNTHVRDLSVYAAGGGTVNLNFVLEDQDSDVHTSLTKLGRGTVNFNGGNLGAGARDGTVEQITLAGGLLRLTGYGTNTGRRVDSGAMVVFAGGGIEMDGVGSIANETENLTGTAVSGATAVPVGQTIVNPGGTDVIVTSMIGRTTTLNIGSSGIALVRNTGGSLNFVQNNNGGSAVISFNGAGVTAGSSAASFNSFIGGYATFTDTPGSITNWAGLNNAFRVGAFTGLTADGYGAGVHTDVVTGAGVGTQSQSLRFNTSGAGLNLAGGVFSVNSGGILATSNLAATTAISNGTLTRTGGGDLVIHNYGTGSFQIGAGIANAGANAVSLALTGTGTIVLSGTNTYTGSTYFNGGTVSVSTEANLGAVPASVTANNLYFDGGVLHTTATMALSENRGITLGGNGGEVRVAAGTTFTLGGTLSSEASLTAGYSSNPAVGRFDKSGTGTLLLTSLTNAHNGLTDVREGTLKWQPNATTGSVTLNVFGSTNAFLDGTVVRSGATLDLSPRTAANNSSVSLTLNEWFTFEGGSRVDFSRFNDATNGFSDVRYNLRGVIQLDAKGAAGTPAGNTTFNVVRREVSLGDAGGYITGDGGITKVGNGVLYFRESNPEWTGQLVHNEGMIEIYSAGKALGTGTLPILLGHNLAAELAGEADSANNAAQLFIRDENGFADEVIVSQDVIVRADGGAGVQTKRIGARYLAHEDIASWNGTLTLNDNVEFFYQDDARNINDQFNASSSTAGANTRNDIRSYGAPTNAEVTFINFNGSIIGGKNITTNVTQGGNGNVANGSIVDPFDDMVLLPVFGLNGDNSAWTGSLIMGNTASDVDRIHTVSIGSDKGISAGNAVTMHHNAILRASGNDVTIGSLSNPAGAASIGAFIENASTTSGTITIVQKTDATVGIVFRDGLNYEELKPGEVDASLSVVKAGAGKLELTKTNTYTGSTTLNDGILKLSYGANGSMLSDTAVLRLNDGVLELGGTVAHEEVVGGTVVNGAATITRTSGAATIRLNTLTRLSGTLHISEDNLATTDTQNDPATGIIGAWATVGGSWAVNSTNGPDGALVGLTSFTDVNRLGGVIPNAPAANLRIIEAGTAGNITLAAPGATTINTLLQGANGGTAVVDIGAGNVLRVASGGVLLPADSSSLTFAPAGSLTAGASDDAAARLLLQNQDAAAILTVAAAITNNGAGIVGL
ncbi:MAG TPA: autotransporter-associated beta strand repeat-containing protein, partial [Prosthecobacter sp.]|nr:autotransporter-associated beta strand repeat-containing protein [Prosthecobacter sp.]